VIRAINLPSNFSNGTFNLVGVFENHERFSVDLFRHVLSLLSGKVFFEHINFVVLLHASLTGAGEISSGGSETESGVSVELLGVTLYVLLIGGINLVGPSSNYVGHTSVFSFNTVSLNSMLRKDGDVVHGDLVGVSEEIMLSDSGVGHLLADHLSLGVLELRVSSKVLACLGVFVNVSHR